jgi:hypothetical protein
MSLYYTLPYGEENWAKKSKIDFNGADVPDCNGKGSALRLPTSGNSANSFKARLL